MLIAELYNYQQCSIIAYIVIRFNEVMTLMVKLTINGKQELLKPDKYIGSCEIWPNSSNYSFNHEEHQNTDEGQLMQLDSAVIANLNKLKSLVGLEQVKQNIYEICAYISIQKKRRQLNLPAESQTLHMIFMGAPGTGKTTIARILGEIFKNLTYLPSGHLVEVERADLVGEYIGQTAQKTKKQIEKAQGGILFVDEAYALARGGSTDFGKEAIDTLVKSMEDYKDNLVVILAGYQEEMKVFLKSNPGLSSRFPIQISFPDYTEQQLIKIADKMLEDRKYFLETPAKKILAKMIRTELNSHEMNFSNARFVRNLIEKSIRRQAMRLVKKQFLNKSDLMCLKADDLINPDST